MQFQRFTTMVKYTIVGAAALAPSNQGAASSAPTFGNYYKFNYNI